MTSGLRARRDKQSPLEELKELLKRTSQVEKALGRFDADPAVYSGNPFSDPVDCQEHHDPHSGKEVYHQHPLRGLQHTAGHQQPRQNWQEDGYHEEENQFQIDKCEERRSGGTKTFRRIWRARDSAPENNVSVSPRAGAVAGQLESPRALTTAKRTPAQKALGTSKSVPRTPLAMSLAKLQQSEEAWRKERVQLRRESDQQRKRNSALDHRISQLQSLHKHQKTEMRSLKSALQQRDGRLEELENQLRQEHGEAGATAQAYQQQIDALKGERQELQRLLGAALKQLQNTGKAAASEMPAEQAAGLEGARMAAERAQREQQEAEESVAWKMQTLQRVMDMQLEHNRQKRAELQLVLSDCTPAD